ncbi:MAG: nucleotidyltransferase domain-containing protein [Methanobrevibacter sp.]|jgi:predicted nucleotidyltransferase|nr:nucleotidyltransferase domain-containing protein [Candidatus Methanoflexus mossambicus]
MNRKQIAIDFAKSLNCPEIEKIILFGSVARGEDNINSDIDILIITKNINDKIKIEDDIYSKVFNILLKTNEYLSVKMRSINHYEDHKDFPFYENIENEGILIG